MHHKLRVEVSLSFDQNFWASNFSDPYCNLQAADTSAMQLDEPSVKTEQENLNKAPDQLYSKPQVEVMIDRYSIIANFEIRHTKKVNRTMPNCF